MYSIVYINNIIITMKYYFIMCTLVEYFFKTNYTVCNQNNLFEAFTKMDKKKK